MSKSTCYRLIERFEKELDDDLVQIVSIESGNAASDNNASAEKSMPELVLSKTDKHEGHTPAPSEAYPVAESSLEDSESTPQNSAYPKYPYRKYYHRRDVYRDNHRLDHQWSTINLKGIRINFDLAVCSTDLINRLITVIKEN